MDPQDARISVLDRGFLYGDSVYEVARVYGGVPFALEAHIERLYESGERIGFVLPWSRDDLRGAIKLTLEAASAADAYLRVIATRGCGPIDLAPRAATDPQLIIMVLEPVTPPPEAYENGRSAWTVSVRRNLKRAVDPRAKTGNYMNNVLAAADAHKHGADEAIMLDVDGRVAEGSSANVWALIEGIWVTPPLDVGILGGITRQTMLSVCERAAVAAEERVIWPEDLAAADEICISSSMREILPIVELNGQRVGSGKVGPGTTRLHELYRAEVATQTQSW